MSVCFVVLYLFAQHLCWTSGFASFWASSINGLHRPSNPYMYELLEKATEIAMEECQQHFKWSRWNCPSSVFSSNAFQLHPTKETAFVSAVTAAAVVHVLAKNCSRGGVGVCSCDPQYQGEGRGEAGESWVWGGCSDNLEYGELVSKKVLDTAERGLDSLTYSKLHNYAVGREVVRGSLEKHCKCHGMSGSCVVKSCWMQVAPFTQVVGRIRQAYDQAVRVGFESGDAETVDVVIGNSVSGSKLSAIPKVRSAGLIYLHDSPNYCKPGNNSGWRGTKGRACSRRKGDNVSEVERKSCKELCRSCGFQVRKKKRVVTRHCNCSFQWCCHVKCDSCRQTIQEHFCA